MFLWSRFVPSVATWIRGGEKKIKTKEKRGKGGTGVRTVLLQNAFLKSIVHTHGISVSISRLLRKRLRFLLLSSFLYINPGILHL